MLIIFIGFHSIFGKSKIEQINEIVGRYYHLGLFNGCILVAENGQKIYESAMGYTDFNRNELLTLDHRFRLASLSKQFTAMAMMILDERDSLSINENVRKYLPELPYRYIQIKHLLTHTSGLPDYGMLLDEHWDIENKFKDRRSIVSNEDAFKLLIELEPQTNFFAGQRYEYSDTGYMLLALIVERVTGMQFQDFIKEAIFKPLQMSDSYVNRSTGILDATRRAKGYRLNDLHTGYESYDFHYQNGMYGDGGVISTVRDLFKWDQALYTDILVSETMLQRAFSPFMLYDSTFSDYGFGWSIISTDSGKIFAHGGSWLGYRTFILRYPESKSTVIQLCNMPGINDGELAFKIYDILKGKSVEMPQKSIANELMEIINNSDMGSARDKFYSVLGQKNSNYRIDENELLDLSHRLMDLEKIPEAIEILRLCTVAFPNSVQVYNDLAQIYLLIDEGELAIDCLQKSLILNPENNLAAELLSDLNLEFDRAPTRTIHFRVIPKIIVEGDDLYITGNHSNLGSWNPGAIKLYEEHDRTWTREVKLNEGMMVEYKITRGHWDNEAVNEQGLVPPNYTFKVQSDTTIEVNVANWKDLMGDN